MPDSQKELEKIAAAEPPAKRLAQELGPFKTCKAETYSESPDGSWNLHVTDERATPEENLRRKEISDEALADRRELDAARHLRRQSETATVAVTDVRDGSVREIDAKDEDRMSKKKWARPGRGRKTYFLPMRYS